MVTRRRGNGLFFIILQIEKGRLAPGFATASSDYTGYHNYINSNLPQESPHFYGLHPNTEIYFLTATAETLLPHPNSTKQELGVTKLLV